LVADASAAIKLTVWDGLAEHVEPGDIIRVAHAYVPRRGRARALRSLTARALDQVGRPAPRDLDAVRWQGVQL
jgi:hypothetical protein